MCYTQFVSARDRNSVAKSKSSDCTYSREDLKREFPDDTACLEWLKNFLYADSKGLIFCVKCKKATAHYRVKTRASYSCQFCGNHVYPMAGTIFEHSSTSLATWFQAIYLMSSTRCGVSAKHLERELGVTYKTAWRMFHQIRGKLALLPQIQKHVLPETMIYSDEWTSYAGIKKMGMGYRHRRIHHLAHVYVDGDVHTNTIEGFWALPKRGIGGAHHAVSRKYLQMYLDEFAFRYNHRKDERPMFRAFLENVRTASALASSTPSY